LGAEIGLRNSDSIELPKTSDRHFKFNVSLTRITIVIITKSIIKNTKFHTCDNLAFVGIHVSSSGRFKRPVIEEKGRGARRAHSTCNHMKLLTMLRGQRFQNNLNLGGSFSSLTMELVIVDIVRATCEVTEQYRIVAV
jgi:hypothetical protein